MISNNDRKILEEARHRFSSKINLFTNARNEMFPTKNPPNSIYLCEKPNVHNKICYQYYEEEVKEYLKKRGFNFSLLNKKLSLLKCGEIFYEVLFLSPRNFFQDVKFCAEAVDVFPPIICKYIDDINDDLSISVIEDAAVRFPCLIKTIKKRFYFTEKFKKQLIETKKYFFDPDLLKKQILFNGSNILDDLNDYEELLPSSCKTWARGDSYMLSKHLINELNIKPDQLTSDNLKYFDIDISDIDELKMWNDINLETFVRILFKSTLYEEHINRKNADEIKDISKIVDYLYQNRGEIKDANLYLEAVMILLDFENSVLGSHPYPVSPYFMLDSKCFPYLVYEYWLRGEKRYTQFCEYYMSEMIDNISPFQRVLIENDLKKIKSVPSFKRMELKRIVTRNLNAFFKEPAFLFGYSGYKAGIIRGLKNCKNRYYCKDHYYCKKLVGYAKNH